MPHPRSDEQSERRADQPVRADNSVLRALLQPRGDGAPLPPGIAAQMRGRLGHDFADVRVHDDAHSNATARSLDAQAYTTGEDIVLGAAAPALDSAEGRTMLAHELTHVVQQREAGHLVDEVSRPGDATERAADNAAHGVPATPTAAVVPAVARQPALGKERMPVSREQVESMLADWLENVLATQGRRTIDKTPQVIEAITSLFKGDPVRQASVAEWLKGTTDGTPKGLAHQVAGKLPAEIPEDRLDKIKGPVKSQGPPDDRPKTAGDAAGRTVVDSTIAPIVRGSGLSKDKQDKIISAARSAVADGVIAILDQALDGFGVGGPAKNAIHNATQAAINQQPGKAMDRQQEGAGSPYRQEPPPGVAPANPAAPGQRIFTLPPIKWDVPGATTPHKPPAQIAKTDPGGEKAALAVDPKALVPDGVTAKDAEAFGTAVDFALDVARKLDDAQAKKTTNLMIEMGAQYENVKDRAGVFQRAQTIVFAMRDALPHHAALVARVSFTVNGRVAYTFSLHPSPQ